MAITSALRRDANATAIQDPAGMLVNKTITYAAATTGATGASTLFTVTGDVIVSVFAVCSSDLTSGGAATIEVGIAGNTAAIIAQTTATGIDSGEIWKDDAPATVETLPTEYILTGGADVIQTIATDTITGGVLKYYCFWRPLSEDANVVAA